jgi:hypothetical protein
MALIQIVLFSLIFLWLIGISVVMFLEFRIYKKLEKESGELSLKKTFEKIISQEDKNKSAIEEIIKEIHKLQEDGKLHVQRVGLVRFNPFRETGGDHSFSLALLDGRGTGVLVTGLHTRERTRLYMKAVKNGKCEFELSNEEKKALEKAL